MISKVYKTVVDTVDSFVPRTLRPLWQHPAGPKTVFFWAPALKWSLVLAGLGDITSRPIETISVSQCSSLAISGLIWSRYSVVIIPKNYSLLAVNLFMVGTNLIQIARFVIYQQNALKDIGHKKQL